MVNPFMDELRESMESINEIYIAREIIPITDYKEPIHFMLMLPFERCDITI